MKTFKPKVDIESGEVPGYGGPGFYWIKGVYDNRRLYYIQGYSEADAAVKAERERLKWEKRWPNKESFLKAISRKKRDSPLCSNCGNATGNSGSLCLDRSWCAREECRQALAKAREDYQIEQQQRKIDDEVRRDRERKDSIKKIDLLTQCFHFRDGWFFRREKDGSVRIMHREYPASEYLRVNIAVSPESWASIVCSVSNAGETADRWETAKEFHGKPPHSQKESSHAE